MAKHYSSRTQSLTRQLHRLLLPPVPPRIYPRLPLALPPPHFRQLLLLLQHLFYCCAVLDKRRRVVVTVQPCLVAQVELVQHHLRLGRVLALLEVVEVALLELGEVVAGVAAGGVPVRKFEARFCLWFEWFCRRR